MIREVGVEWGWRIRCMHPDCDKVHESWSSEGTPPLPGTAAHLGGPLVGWLFRYRRHNHFDHPPGHLAFCPEHSPPVTRWMADLLAWQNARREIGRVRSKSMLELIREWLNPEAARAAHDTEMRNAVREWEASNPRPTPPWRS